MTYGPYACGNNFDAPGDCSESSVCANAIPSQCWGACTYNGGGFRFYAAIVDGACTCMIECYDYNTQPSCGPGYWACQSDYDCPGDSPCNRSSGCCYYDQYYS